MTVRERMEQEEYDVLSPQAQKAAETKGRPSPEEDNDVRTCYQRDADRILHSKSFRRLMHKTQVFLSPEGDHYRTRMTHTLEVARIARTICRGLRLNQDLAEAAAYGHDLGHTPFGHAGEKALSSMMEKPFRHNEQSLRVVDKLERGGTGLKIPEASGNHKHSVCGEVGCTEHGGDVVWTEWTNSGALPAQGSFCLETDVDLGKGITVAPGTTLNICLNGHSTGGFGGKGEGHGGQQAAQNFSFHRFFPFCGFFHNPWYRNPSAGSNPQNLESVPELPNGVGGAAHG